MLVHITRKMTISTLSGKFRWTQDLDVFLGRNTRGICEEMLFWEIAG